MIINQLRRNSVAIISLVVALSGLAYNTWRNEESEANRNIRDAGLFMMKELAHLQEVVLYARYDQADDRGDLKTGWSHVLAVKDISYAMPENVQSSAAMLVKVWSEYSHVITADEQNAYQAIDQAIDEVKQEIIISINALR